MSICTDVGSFIESKTTVVQTSNVGFTSEVSDYLVVHTGPGDFHDTFMPTEDDAVHVMADLSLLGNEGGRPTALIKKPEPCPDRAATLTRTPPLSAVITPPPPLPSPCPPL